MNHNTTTDYAINKLQPNKIIYRSVTNEQHYFELKNGVVTEHYLNENNPSENYSRISDEISVENFEQLKIISDYEYSEEEKAEEILYKVKRRMKISPTLFTDKEFSVEEELQYLEFLNDYNKEIHEQLKISSEILKKMTEIQKRRFLLYHISDKSTYEIAELEGVDHKAVWYSLNACNKKIKKFFKKVQKTTP